jgi:small ligand-binding sensory domain FIST
MPADTMMFLSAATTEGDVDAALADLARQIAVQAGDSRLDLMIAFVSSQFTFAARQIVQDLYASNQPGVLLGCTAEGVIGRDREIEGQPAISLVAARLPGAVLTPYVLNPADTDWHKLLFDQEQFRCLVEAPGDTHLFIMLGDPFSTPMDDVLQAFNTCYHDIPVVGGMASGAMRPNGNALFLNEQVLHEGIVGVAISGQVEVDVVVSQGCRPIWRPFKVLQAHRNVIFNLEGRAPLAWLQDLIPELSAEDRALLQTGLFVGRSIKPGQEVLGRGDFLIRGVVGIDQQNGAIAIGDSVMEGETIQFHLRDAVTAQEDLEMMLIPQLFRTPPGGGLLFSCNGRGTRLYDHPNGDISVIQQHLENTHLAGFFCAGEIGPVGGANFLHGHTASLVIFRPTQTA